MKTKKRIEIACLIIFMAMWLLLDVFVGRYVRQLYKESGALILIKDIIVAYLIPLVIGWVIIICSWAYVCDKLD